MASTKHPERAPIAKAPTGIPGLDEATHGGLPRGRATLVEGSAGAGKTVLSLQSIVHAASRLDEPALFVTFEENSSRIVANAAGFGWDLPALQKSGRFAFIDAQPDHDLVQSGEFDLRGLLAALDAKVAQTGARRIVFDAIDVVLSLLGDAVAERRELYRLHEWLLARELTAIITAKSGAAAAGRLAPGFMQFMVDCAIQLDHQFVTGVSQRSLRLLKYRGSDFQENEAPFIIGADGFDVASVQTTNLDRPPATEERLSSGVARLDAMLGGGYFRGSSILLTGAPGTAKTTLCAAFAEAACLRGEPTVFIGFDSDNSELVRNVRSVGIRLDRFRDKGRKPGLLCMVHFRAVIGSAESHLLRIRNLSRKHKARCIVIDPASALILEGNVGAGQGVMERLIDWAKTERITLLCSSLLDASAADSEMTPLQISTIADVWIHLRYLVRAGERNRGLSILKSRGTAHSNQVRELILSDQGVTLADTYTAGGEVLMGTMRWEREQAEQAARDSAEAAQQASRQKLLMESSELSTRLAALQIELDAKQAGLQALSRKEALRAESAEGDRTERRSRRGADADAVKRKRRPA